MTDIAQDEVLHKAIIWNKSATEMPANALIYTNLILV